MEQADVSDRAFDWVTFSVSVAVAGFSWSAWAGVATDAVTAWGFAATMVALTVWASTRERYPLSVMLGTAASLAVVFVALYAHESPLWVVGLQMLLCAVLGPQVLLFLSARLVGAVVGRRPWSAAAGAR